MFIEGIYKFLLFLKNHGQSQYFSPEEIINALNRAQNDKYVAEIRNFEKTSRITNAMRPFKVTKDIDVDSNNLYPLPPDYNYDTNIGSLITENNVESEYPGKIYTDGEWLDAKTSQLLPPDDKNIKARIISESVEVVPVVPKIRFYYLKNYADAVFAYDTVGNKHIFKEEGSVDPEWPPMEHNDLLMRTLRYLGIPLQSKFFVAAEDFIKQPATSNTLT